MRDTFAPPSASTALRRAAQWAWRDADGQSTMIGLGGVIVFLLLLVLAWMFDIPLISPSPVALRPHTTAREFNIEINPEVFAKQPKPPDPSRFVETNPDAPENVPDKTNNFAAQNQQAAQEKPNPEGKSDRAATEGKKDFESNQIVSGRLTQPMERLEPQPPPTPETPPAETPTSTPRAEQNPLAGTEKFQGDNAAGIGGSVAKRLENPKDVPEKIDGAKDAPQVDQATALRPAIDPHRPRPRPQIVRTQQVRPAVLADNPVGTRNVGLSGIDAQWSNYGAYLQKMVDIVQIQWERLILQMGAMPSNGSIVTVKFVMNDDGKITDIVNVDSTAGETGKRACISAITDRSPYGPWTDDMKAVLGSQQEMTFTFYYQ